MVKYRLFGLATAALLVFSSAAYAENGVTATEVVFGQTTALGGPASALGTGMRDGITAAFKQVNDAGGVNGRQLVLKTLDDGYEPDKALENAKKLINEDKVFALIGEVGTPTSKAVEPVTTEAKVPFIGPFTGAEFLRNPYKRYVVNVRGSYFQEAEVWVKHLTEDLGAKNISILYQDDSFGLAGYDGLKKALEKRSMAIASEGKFQRNSTAVKEATLAIKKGNPEAIVTVGPYAPVAEFIKTAHQVGMNVPILNISFVGPDALAAALSEGDRKDVIVTQVVPFPQDTTIPLVKEYQAALKASSPDAKPGFVSLEGYMVGKLAAEGLKKVSGEPTREAMLDAFSGTFDLGGVTLQYGADDNQGSDNIFLTRINPDGTFKAITSLKDLN